MGIFKANQYSTIWLLAFQDLIIFKLFYQNLFINLFVIFFESSFAKGIKGFGFLN